MGERPEEPWTLCYDPRVRKCLEKIRDKAVIRRIKQAAAHLALAPYSGKELEGHPRVRSERVGTPGGEYRVLYQLLEEEREVFIVLVGSREEVYGLLERKSR